MPRPVSYLLSPHEVGRYFLDFWYSGALQVVFFPTRLVRKEGSVRLLSPSWNCPYLLYQGILFSAFALFRSYLPSLSRGYQSNHLFSSWSFLSCVELVFLRCGVSLLKFISAQVSAVSTLIRPVIHPLSFSLTHSHISLSTHIYNSNSHYKTVVLLCVLSLHYQLTATCHHHQHPSAHHHSDYLVFPPSCLQVFWRPVNLPVLVSLHSTQQGSCRQWPAVSVVESWSLTPPKPRL